MTKFFYTYKLTHKTTSEFYIGSRSSNIIPINDLGIFYFSSSKYVLSRGFENFKYEIIKTYETHDECYWDEQQMIKDSLSPLCLNRQYYDKQSNHRKFSFYGMKFKHDDKTKEKIKEKRKLQTNLGVMSDKAKLKMSIERKGIKRPAHVGIAVGIATAARTGTDLAKSIGIKAKLSREANGTTGKGIPRIKTVCRLRDRKEMDISNFFRYP